MQLTSPAFRNGDEIPAHYTCDGENVSPPLEWSGVPAKTLSLALIVDDPDAPGGDFTHWVLYGLLPATLSLPGNLRQEQFAGAASQGANDFQSVGYGGPCPPPGAAHHYIFTLFALDTALNRPPGISRAQLEAAMKGHIIAQARLMGTYQRQ